MRALSTGELDRMRDVQDDAMGDECKIGTLSETVSGGHVSESYTYGSAIACGFDASGNGEASDGSQAGITTAALRLPIDTVVSSASRVQVTKRNGATLASAEYFSVVGDPRRGPTCLTVDLVRVHGNRRA